MNKDAEWRDCQGEERGGAVTTKERSILFSEPMVREILDGRKTQTRQVVRPQPCYNENVGFIRTDRKGRCLASGLGFSWEETCRNFIRSASPYAVGNRLWVQEKWALRAGADTMMPIQVCPRRVGIEPIWYATGEAPAYDKQPKGKWRPSTHMPRWASRITLEVVRVRVERLQEITEEDAIAEGYKDVVGKYGRGDEARIWFASTWENIHSKRGFRWNSNPWVWVVEFKVKEIKQQ